MVAVTLRITDEEMTSDATAHTAVRVPGVGWSVSWLPGRMLGRNQAVTAMMLADEAAAEQLGSGHELWPVIEAWAEQLGMTGPEAVARVSEPPLVDEHQAAADATDVADPGPVPERVEPDTCGAVTTISASPRAQVRVTTDVGRTGLTGLSLDTAAGESVTVALSTAQVDAVCEALAAAVPMPYVPQLPEVRVWTGRPQLVGGEYR